MKITLFGGVMKNFSYLLLFILFFLAHQGHATACPESDLASFRHSAQVLDTGTPNRGYQAIESCPDRTGEILFWLAFTQDVGAIPVDTNTIEAQLTAHAPYSSELPPKEEALALARRGQSAALASLVENGEFIGENPSEEREALLALGRALAWDRKLAESQRAYERLLRQLSEAPPTPYQLEYAFTFIWQENYIQARNLLTELQSQPELAENDKQSITHGLDLIRRLQGQSSGNFQPAQDTAAQPDHPAAAPSEDAAKKHRYSMGLVTVHQQERLQANHSFMRYSGFFEAAWLHHSVTPLLFSDEEKQSDNFELAYPFASSLFDARAAFGYLTEETDPFSWDVDLLFRFLNDLEIWAGLSRTHIFDEVPLPQRAFSLFRDEVEVGAAWVPWVKLHYKLLQDKDGIPYDDLSLEFSQSLLKWSAGAHQIKGILGTAFEGRTRPSPFYETWRRSFEASIGLASIHNLGRSLRGESRFLFHRLWLRPFGRESFENEYLWAASAKIAYQPLRILEVSAEASYDFHITNNPNLPEESDYRLLLGATLLNKPN